MDHLSDGEPELSDSWSDHSNTSCGEHSMTYKYIWSIEEDKVKALESIKETVAHVDAAALRLEKLTSEQPERLVPFGGLKGTWHLWNVDVCPWTFEPTEKYYRLIIANRAVDRSKKPHTRWRLDKKKLPYAMFIQWDIGFDSGGIIPFAIPVHASMEHVSIELQKFGGNVPVQITFLGDDCLRIRVPGSLLQDERLENKVDADSIVEFAGCRVTEAFLEERGRRAEQRPPSPRNSIAMSMLGFGDSD